MARRKLNSSPLGKELVATDADEMVAIEQAVLSPVFPVSLVVVLTVPVRLPSVTSAVPVVCSLPPRSGASGTRRST
jgi:hypothetical protein